MSDQPSAQTVGFASRDDGEELARAEVYGLLAALFQRRPTPRCCSSWRR